MLTSAQCEIARKSRDSRYDGQFVVAVKSTGIFCRPICPANLPKESNVEYFAHSTQALKAKYRPCLRCRPESAPGSWAWQGVETTFMRALTLIDEGALQEANLPDLATRLGITDRYLRKLFANYLGMSPKTYSQYQQLMLAKQLLHGSHLPIQDIAISSGFNSVRRFNDAFKKHLQLTPSELKRKKPSDHHLELELPIRGDLDFDHLLSFYRLRAVSNVELISETSYQRSFSFEDQIGVFRISKSSSNLSTLKLELQLSKLGNLRKVISHIRRQFDLDADTDTIEHHLKACGIPIKKTGIRIPGIGSSFEAGVRAILGQQVSVKAAINNLNLLVANLGQPLADVNETFAQTSLLFPSPATLANADLSFLKMPASRKQALNSFGQYVAEHGYDDVDSWLSIKGVGPWTIGYVKLRGINEPDCFLDSDLVIKKALALLPNAVDSAQLSPWGSYATFHLWQSQSE